MKHNLRKGPNPCRFNGVPWVSLNIVDSMPWLTSKTAIDWWRIDILEGNPFGDIDPRPRFWSDIHESIVFKTLSSKRTCPFKLWLTLLWTAYLCTNWYFHAAAFISKFSERALLQTSLYFPQSKISSYGLGIKAAKIGPDLMLSITLPFVLANVRFWILGMGRMPNFTLCFLSSPFSPFSCTVFSLC